MSRPLHILTLSTLFPHRAAPNFGIFVERQTKELASRNGIMVSVVAPMGCPPWPLNLLPTYRHIAAQTEHEEWRGLQLYRPRFRLLPAIGGRNNPDRMAAAILSLVQEIHARQPIDVIDAEFFYPDGPTAMQLASELKLPFTIKARGADIHYWGSQAGCREKMLMAAEEATALLAVSAALKQDMIAMGMEDEKISVHYTGVDQEKFRPVDRNQAKEQLGVSGPLLITTGALIERKNQELVIRALASLPKATLLLAGKGPAESRYRKLAQQLGVDDRVRFLGTVPHDELPLYTAAADAAILVSQSEGLANAWVEALACGTPLVLSSAGGAAELVSDQRFGHIVDADVAAIQNAVRDLIDHPRDPAEVRTAISRFSWQKNGDQLEKLFRDIAARRSD